MPHSPSVLAARECSEITLICFGGQMKSVIEYYPFFLHITFESMAAATISDGSAMIHFYDHRIYLLKWLPPPDNIIT